VPVELIFPTWFRHRSVWPRVCSSRRRLALERAGGKNGTDLMATWIFDTAHSSIGFSVRHLMIAKVHGRFERFEGTITYNPDNLAASKVTVQIAAASVSTNEAKRDGHLRSADFFDAEKYPQLTFESTKIVPGKGDEFDIHGKLTIRGVTKDVVLKAESLGRAKDPWGGEHASFTAHTSINRTDFGLNWNQALEAGGVLVGEKVDIHLEIQLLAK
jgi:polyisoprenoid-binding protein YceI